MTPDLLRTPCSAHCHGSLSDRSLRKNATYGNAPSGSSRGDVGLLVLQYVFEVERASSISELRKYADIMLLQGVTYHSYMLDRSFQCQEASTSWEKSGRES